MDNAVLENFRTRRDVGGRAAHGVIYKQTPRGPKQLDDVLLFK